MDYIPRIQKEGYKKSIELAKKYNLYRQEYVDVFYGKNNDERRNQENRKNN